MVFLELSVFRKAFRFIGALLCDVIYTLISRVYELFMTVARLNILSSNQIQPIYQRVTMILTIVMIFYITFEFVKYTISPDTITDKEKGAGNILKRIIIVVVLIALVPEIFTKAYELQNRIIKTQLISKIILGTNNSNYTTYGNDFSANMLNLFYYYDSEACSSSNAGLINECSEAQQVVTEKMDHIRQIGDSNIVDGINLASGKATFKEVNPAIKFNGILAIVVGGFILYILVMYSIDVGTRYAQLIFLQVISPIAIMGYLLPKKDGIFQKWGKQCITTYIDLFLRIAIINFILLITKVLGDAFQTGSIFEGMEVSNGLKAFTYIVLVLGLLAFAQRAPKLLSELFPSMGNAGIGFGLKAADRVAPGAARAIGASAAGLGALVRGGVARGVNVHRQNLENLDKRRTAAETKANREAQRNRNQEFRQARSNLKSAIKRGSNTPEDQANLQKAREAFRNARNAQIEAQSAVAEDLNRRKRSVAGAVLGGALSGAATGVSTGFEATKLEDIRKKVNEGTKKVNDKNASIEKYYDAGGTNLLDRKLTQMQQSVGIQTQSQRTAEEIRKMDSKIKLTESVINLQRTTKKNVDSAEDRGKSKAQEGQLKLSAENITIKTGVGDEKIVGTKGQSLGDIYQEYHKRAEEQKARLEAALNNNADETTVAAIRKESALADKREQAILKNVSRAAFTQYIQSDNPYAISGADAVMINHVENTKNSFERAFEDTGTKNKVLATIAEMKQSDNKQIQEKASAYEKIISGEYASITFDDVDDLKNLLIKIADDTERELSKTKADKATLETSSIYDAQKANADNGGK